MSKRFQILLTVASAALLSTQALAQDLFIQDANLVTATGQQAETDILIRDGRIVQIGTNLTTPAGLDVLDGAGQWVTPGLFSSFSTLGLVDIGAEGSTNDVTASDAETSVSERAVDSFNPRTAHIANTRRRGVTHAVVSPSPSGDSIFAGTGLIASTTGDFDSVVQDRAFVHVALGETGASRAGGSRSAALAQLRAALDDAQAYPNRFRSPTDGDALSRQDAAALAPALGGDIPLIISANRASDLLGIVRLKAEYPNLNIIVRGATEGWQVADALAEADIKVIVDPVQDLPSNFEDLGARYENILLLDEAGVDYAIANLTSFRVTKPTALGQHAGNAVGNGLSWDKAFAAITTTPARWFGLPAPQVSTGPITTLVVWDGDPLEATSAPLKVWIDGEEQSLESRQSLLRDRYNPLNESDMPHKYR